MISRCATGWTKVRADGRFITANCAVPDWEVMLPQKRRRAVWKNSRALCHIWLRSVRTGPGFFANCGTNVYSSLSEKAEQVRPVFQTLERDLRRRVSFAKVGFELPVQSWECRMSFEWADRGRPRNSNSRVGPRCCGVRACRNNKFEGKPDARRSKKNKHKRGRGGLNFFVCSAPAPRE